MDCIRYGAIIVKKELKSDLANEAEKEGLSVPAFLRVLLNEHIKKNSYKPHGATSPTL